MKDVFGSALQGFRGFGERARTSINQAKDEIVQSATQVTENVSTQSAGKLLMNVIPLIIKQIPLLQN